MPNHATKNKDAPLDSGLWAIKALQASGTTITNGAGETLPEAVNRLHDYTENIINSIHDRAVYMCRKVANMAKKGEPVLYHHLVYNYHNTLESNEEYAEFNKLASEVIFGHKSPAEKIFRNALAGGYLVEPLFVTSNRTSAEFEKPIGPGLNTCPEIPDIPASIIKWNNELKARPRYAWRIIIPTTLEEYHTFKKRMQLRLQAMGADA